MITGGTPDTILRAYVEKDPVPLRVWCHLWTIYYLLSSWYLCSWRFLFLKIRWIQYWSAELCWRNHFRSARPEWLSNSVSKRKKFFQNLQNNAVVEIIENKWNDFILLLVYGISDYTWLRFKFRARANFHYWPSCLI